MTFIDRIKSYFIGNTNTITPSSREIRAYNDLRFRNSGLTYAEYYKRIPELRAIIDQQADMFNKIELAGNKKVIKKLKSPNYLQTGNEFFSMAFKQFSLYSLCIFYHKAPAGFEGVDIGIDKTDIFVLPVENVQIELHTNRKNLYEVQSLKDVIKHIWYISNGKKTELKIDNILIVNETGLSLDDAISGNSRLTAARSSLDNLLAIAESKNVFAYNRGAIGIFAPENPRTDTTIFTEDDKTNVQTALNQYGTLAGQKQYMIIPYPVRFQKTVLSPKELDFDSMILREKINLSDLLGHNILLLNETAGSTFSNYETARKIIYENRIIPVFNTIIAGINDIFKITDSNPLIGDYSKIEALQADKKLKAEIDEKSIKNVVDINNAVNQGSLNYDVALQLLQDLGYTTDQSRNLLNKQKISDNGTGQTSI